MLTLNGALFLSFIHLPAIFVTPFMVDIASSIFDAIENHNWIQWRCRRNCQTSWHYCQVLNAVIYASSLRRLGSCDKYIERQKHRDDEVGNVDDLAYEQIDRNTADRIGLLRLKPRCCR